MSQDLETKATLKVQFSKEFNSVAYIKESENLLLNYLQDQLRGQRELLAYIQTCFVYLMVITDSNTRMNHT